MDIKKGMKTNKKKKKEKGKNWKVSENRWKNVVWDNKEKNQHNLAEKLEKCKKVNSVENGRERRESWLKEKNVIMRQLKKARKISRKILQ